jgi:hypothetical protein
VYFYRIEDFDDARMMQSTCFAHGIPGDRYTRAVGGYVKGKYAATCIRVLSLALAKLGVQTEEDWKRTRLVAWLRDQMELSMSMRSPTEYPPRGPPEIAEATADLRKSIYTTKTRTQRVAQRQTES